MEKLTNLLGGIYVGDGFHGVGVVDCKDHESSHSFSVIIVTLHFSGGTVIELKMGYYLCINLIL